MSDEKEEPKLIIDDDWKEQVQKEKEQLTEEASANEASSPSEGSEEMKASESSDASSDETSEQLPPPPPASFEILTSMLATQALIATGQVPNPATGKPDKQIAYARHYVDMLAMLEEKTKGNLSDEENAGLTQTLHQLRMLVLSS